jgi:Metallo-peptidase family M12B Reprolysin-like
MFSIMNKPGTSRPRFMTFGPIAALATAGLAAMTAAAIATPIQPYRWPDHSVIPVLFSPTDWNVNSAEVQSESAAIRSAMREIQKFYAKSLGGRTFRLNDLEVVQGFGRKEDYHIIWNGKNIYEDGVEFDGNMEHAVVEELYARGFPTPPNQDANGYSVVMFVKGAGGWAGGRELGNGDGGWAILGDFCIDSLQGVIPEGAYWWSGRELQMGAAAHELGHTFGLPHPDAYNGVWETTVMGNWWGFPDLGLNTWETNYLGANKAAFFIPEPSAVALLSLSAAVLLSCSVRRRRVGKPAAPASATRNARWARLLQSRGLGHFSVAGRRRHHKTLDRNHGPDPFVLDFAVLLGSRANPLLVPPHLAKVYPPFCQPFSTNLRSLANCRLRCSPIIVARRLGDLDHG